MAEILQGTVGATAGTDSPKIVTWYLLVYGDICLETGRVTMARNTSVSLGDHFTTFIDTQVQAGRYGSASDVVRAGLRLLQEHEAKVKALQDALIAGEQSGEPRPFDGEAFLSRMHAKHAAQHGS